MSADTKEKGRLSRRDFIKIGGIAGIAAHAVTLPFRAFQAGADPKTRTGWVNEEADATQFFNREPFRISLDKLYEDFHPVDEANTRRPDKYSEMAFNRVMQIGGIIKLEAAKAGIIEDTGFTQNPMAPVVPLQEITEEGMQGIRQAVYDNLPDEYFQSHYDEWMERGVDRLMDDIRTNLLRTPLQAKAKSENKTYLALHSAFFTGFADIDPSLYEPKDPDPLTADTMIVSHSPFGDNVVDNRAVVPATGLEERLEFRSPAHAAELIKDVAHKYGATLVGITRLNPDFVYVRGLRGTQPAPAEAPAGGFLSEEETASIVAALDGTEFDGQAVAAALNAGAGDQMATMTALGEAGIDAMAVMPVLQAAGIDPMALGQGGGGEAAEPKAAQFSLFHDDKQEFEVPEHWKYVIVMGIPHEWDQILGGANYAQSVDAYTRLQLAGGRLARFIKEIGFSARADLPGYYYDTIVPPHAVQAGLGQWGRHACVISPETGANMRLAAVITDLEMEVDDPIDIGVAEFCADCKICADLCPTGSISFADSPDGMVSRGYEHWYINTSTCYGMWQTALGSGCRLCIAACPYSRKDNWAHGLVRAIDPMDPTGMVNNTLIWMQQTFFDAPEATDYLPPPDGCYASYRPLADHLDVSKWFTNEHADPQDCV